MGQIWVWTQRSWAFALDAGRAGASRAASVWASAGRQLRLVVDFDHWLAAPTWQDRAAAVSWPRASIVGGVAATLAISLWLVVNPTKPRPHPPRLPTEQEWSANQAAAVAMEAELSPALASANRSVRPGDRP